MPAPVVEVTTTEEAKTPEVEEPVEVTPPEAPAEEKKDNLPTLILPAPLQTLTKNRAQSVNARKRLSTRVPGPITAEPPAENSEESVLFQYLSAASKKDEAQPERKKSLSTSQPVVEIASSGETVTPVENEPKKEEEKPAEIEVKPEEEKKEEEKPEEKKPHHGGLALPGMGFGNIITADVLKNKRLSARVNPEDIKNQESTPSETPKTETIAPSENVAKASVGLRKVQPKVFVDRSRIIFVSKRNVQNPKSQSSRSN